MNNYKEEDIYKKIAKVVHLICNNPTIFVSETDIHALMIKALMEIPCLNPFDKGKKGKGLCSIKSKRGTGSDAVYETMLIHKEYGHNIKSYARSDIVIFDKDEIENINDPINLKQGGKYLTPKYIFEFGTDKSGGTKGYKKHLYGDFIKLFECQDKGNGFLIHIHRFDMKNDAAGGKTDKKIEEYQKKTSEVWKKVKGRKKPEMVNGKAIWDSEYEVYPTWKKDADKNKSEFRFKVLVFFVKIGGHRTGRRGKVQMFNPYSKDDSEFLMDIKQTQIEKIIKIFLGEDEPDLAEIIKSVNKQ